MSTDSIPKTKIAHGPERPSTPDLGGRVAVVTGAGSGIGRAAAIALAEAGAQVVVSTRPESRPAGETTVGMIERAGRSGRFGACDVRSGSDHAALVASVLDEFGRLDIAVNNAGIPGTPGMMHTLDEAAFDEVIAVDLKGVWFGMQQQIAAMLRGDGGAVINVASLGGLVGVPGIAPYTAAKHGVIGLTKAAALEYADKGIRINAVCPAAVWTNITKDLPEELQASLPQGQAIKRFADPEEIGGVIAFLASDAASFMTGAAIPVDGGALAM